MTKNKSNRQNRLPNHITNDLIQSLEDAKNLVLFLVDHLDGRMGDGALTDMYLKAQDWIEVLDEAKKATQTP